MIDDYQAGNTVGMVVDATGLVWSGSSLGLLAVESTALSTTAALTGSALLGWEVGTLINDHVLPTSTKSLIGDTLYEAGNFSSISEWWSWMPWKR
jgi:hypothetical protein